jgi:hypothetical protein
MAPIFKRLLEGVKEDGGEKLVGRAVPGVVELEVPELPIAAPAGSSGVPKEVGVRRPRKRQGGQFLPPAVSDSEELQLFSSWVIMLLRSGDDK